jgi:hypothetical protein
MNIASFMRFSRPKNCRSVKAPWKIGGGVGPGGRLFFDRQSASQEAVDVLRKHAVFA